MNSRTDMGKRSAIVRLTATTLRSLETLLYRRYPLKEWATFFRFGFRRTGWGLLMTAVDLLPPTDGDLDENSSIVVFRARYSRRALLAAEKRELAFGVVHSHPLGFAVRPSALDDEMDAYFAEQFTAYSGGLPYVSMIISQDAVGMTYISGRAFDGGEWLPVSSVLVCGDALNRFDCSPVQVTRIPEDRESTTARLEAVYGQRAATRLRGAIVGIVGCSGTGSPAIHALVRAGVGTFVLVDFDSFTASNLERLHGSTWRDCFVTPPRPKTTMLAEFIRSINPSAKITVCHGNVLDDAVLDELLRCDLVLGCSDTHHARLALSEYAVHYNLPVLDTGVLLESDRGRLITQAMEFTRYDSDSPCALCGGTIDTGWMNVELMSPEACREAAAAAEAARARGLPADQYWKGEPPLLPTVGYLTGTAGHLLAGYAIGWLTGAFAMPASRFQCDIGFPHLGYVDVPRTRRGTCHCGRLAGWADQARPFRSVARPQHWPAPVIEHLIAAEPA